MINVFKTLALACLILSSCTMGVGGSYKCISPDNLISVQFLLTNKGKAGYLITFNDKKVIDSSFFGFKFKNESPIDGELEVEDVLTSSKDATWKTVWGEQKYIRNNYNEMKIQLRERKNLGRKLFVVMELHSGLSFLNRKI